MVLDLAATEILMVAGFPPKKDEPDEMIASVKVHGPSCVTIMNVVQVVWTRTHRHLLRRQPTKDARTA